MDLAAVEQAAKVIPVFVRNEEEEQKPIHLTHGCYRCTNHNRPLSSRSSYYTIVMYREGGEGEFDEPVFGITVSANDSSYRDLTRYHWIRYLISGATGFYGGWSGRAAIEEYPIMFVRLFNAFDGKGVQHKHSRVNIFEYVEDMRPGEELFAQIFEPHAGRPGLYVDPVEELLYANTWDIEDINKFVHIASTDAGQHQRFVGYYWRDMKHDRLKQLKAGDTMPDVEPNRANRMEQINAVVRQAEADRARRLQRRLLEEEARLINPGGGRRPNFNVRNAAAANDNADVIRFEPVDDLDPNEGAF